MTDLEGQRREKPERLEIPREQKPPTRTKHLGSEKGGRLSRWGEAAEATM
jgi:hypothetical protein